MRGRPRDACRRDPITRLCAPEYFPQTLPRSDRFRRQNWMMPQGNRIKNKMNRQNAKKERREKQNQ
jgi:hypothetical protein